MRRRSLNHCDIKFEDNRLYLANQMITRNTYQRRRIVIIVVHPTQVPWKASMGLAIHPSYVKQPSRRTTGPINSINVNYPHRQIDSATANHRIVITAMCRLGDSCVKRRCPILISTSSFCRLHRPRNLHSISNDLLNFNDKTRSQTLKAWALSQCTSMAPSFFPYLLGKSKAFFSRNLPLHRELSSRNNIFLLWMKINRHCQLYLYKTIRKWSK